MRTVPKQAPSQTLRSGSSRSAPLRCASLRCPSFVRHLPAAPAAGCSARRSAALPPPGHAPHGEVVAGTFVGKGRVSSGFIRTPCRRAVTRGRVPAAGSAVGQDVRRGLQPIRSALNTPGGFRSCCRGRGRHIANHLLCALGGIIAGIGGATFPFSKVPKGATYTGNDVYFFPAEHGL